MENQAVLEALGQLIAPYVHEQKKSPFGYVPYGLKASGTPNETAYLYEEGGLFGRCDGPAQLINAMVGPIGFEKALNTGI